VFLGTLKRLLSCFKLQKISLIVSDPKKVASVLMWIALPETHKGIVTDTPPAAFLAVASGGASLLAVYRNGDYKDKERIY
jgi:hypothetical protein